MKNNEWKHICNYKYYCTTHEREIRWNSAYPSKRNPSIPTQLLASQMLMQKMVPKQTLASNLCQTLNTQKWYYMTPKTSTFYCLYLSPMSFLSRVWEHVAIKSLNQEINCFRLGKTVITWNKNPDPIPFLPRFLSLNKSPFFSAAHRCSVDKQQTSRKGNKVQITSAIHKVVQLVGAVVCQSKDSASYQNVLCVTPSQ